MQQQGLPSKKQLARELATLNDPSFQSRREPFLALLLRLQNAGDASDIRALQIELIAEIGALERVALDLDAKHGGPARQKRDGLKVITPKTEETIASCGT
jgi:hypothetical protein